MRSIVFLLLFDDGCSRYRNVVGPVVLGHVCLIFLGGIDGNGVW